MVDGLSRNSPSERKKYSTFRKKFTVCLLCHHSRSRHAGCTTRGWFRAALNQSHDSIASVFAGFSLSGYCSHTHFLLSAIATPDIGYISRSLKAKWGLFTRTPKNAYWNR
jgi:hypothetical protein